MKNQEVTPKLFLTDYASYNEGTQFEFGHWVELDQFSDHLEFSDYITNHFKEADKKSPLYSGQREETMFTDFEGFPSGLYSESYCERELEQLFQFLTLEDQEKINVQILLEQSYDIDEAIEKAEDINPIQYDYTFTEKVEIFEMWFPEAEEIEQSNPYVSIDYDRFIDNEFTEFTIDGINYLVMDNEF